MNFYLFLSIAYLLGSIPFGYILCKWFKKIDIREHGSKNIGATNVSRVVGKPFGIFVFILDAAKGFIAVSLSGWITEDSYSSIQLILFAAGAIAGHTFPVWLKFKGGKGVATSLGVFIAIFPMPTLIAFGIFLVVFLTSRILSLGSLAAAVSFPFLIYFLMPHDSDWLALQIASVLFSIFMFYTHRTNIGRLSRGEEKKLF